PPSDGRSEPDGSLSPASPEEGPPPIHRTGGAGGALGNPIGLSGPPPAGRLPVRLSRRTTTGFPRPHPPRPPSPRCSRSDRRLEWRGSRARPEEIACPQPAYDTRA